MYPDLLVYISYPVDNWMFVYIQLSRSGSLRKGAWRRACHDVLNVWNMVMTVGSPYKGILSIRYLSFPLFWYFSANFLCGYIGRVSYLKM